MTTEGVTATSLDESSPVVSTSQKDKTLFLVGVLVWLGVFALTWPLAFSFGDEVGYIGEARLLMQGRVHPVPDDPGIWHKRSDGPYALIPKYPLFLSVVLVPFVAISPPMVFLLGVLGAIALALMAGRILESWGHSRLWGLVVLMDPTVVLLSRTVMADVGLAFLGLGTWYFLRRRAVWPTVLFAVATIAIKTTGIVTVAALLAGQSLVLYRERRRIAEVVRGVRPLLMGIAVGGAIVIGLNLVSNGTIHSSYNESASDAFGLRFLRTSGVAHLKSLLLCPPLLFVGVLPFWRRRDWAALLVIGISTVMMSVYFFVDWGVGFIDTVVLSRRLLMPAIAFLLVGYAEILARLFERFSRWRFGHVAAVMVPALLALGVGLKHRQWQIPAHRALERAEAWAEKTGEKELGLTAYAFKVGLLFPGRTTFVEGDRRKSNLVLCHAAGGSYRIVDNFRYSCTLPGYRVVQEFADDGYYILERSDRKN